LSKMLHIWCVSSKHLRLAAKPKGRN